MDFTFNEDQLLFQSTVRDFLANECAPEGIRAAWEQHGMPGLIPERPGPRTAHKLNDEVLTVIDVLLADDPKLSSADLAAGLLEELGLTVHPRSIERALARRKKGAR